jgi:hypothetical protein
MAWGILVLEVLFQATDGLLMLKEHGHEHGLQGPGVGGVNPGLEVQPGRLKEPVEVSLVFLPEGPAEFAPALPFLFPHLTVR